MIAGLGVDIVPIEVLRQNMHRPAYLRQVFIASEIAGCLAEARPELRLAAVFAIKEASMKALGAGIWQGVWFTQIEARSDCFSSISVCFSGKAASVYASMGAPRISVTCSYCGEFALATVMLERVP